MNLYSIPEKNASSLPHCQNRFCLQLPAIICKVFQLYSKKLYLDVKLWLKSLRLHKYADLFSRMSYEEMMNLTSEDLDAQVGAPVPLSCVHDVTVRHSCCRSAHNHVFCFFAIPNSFRLAILNLNMPSRDFSSL